LFILFFTLLSYYYNLDSAYLLSLVYNSEEEGFSSEEERVSALKGAYTEQTDGSLVAVNIKRKEEAPNASTSTSLSPIPAAIALLSPPPVATAPPLQVTMSLRNSYLC
jgi:hypothetical protein